MQSYINVCDKNNHNCLHYGHTEMSSVLVNESIATTMNSQAVCSASEKKVCEDELDIFHTGHSTPTKHRVHEVVCPGAPKKPKHPPRVAGLRQ